MCEFKFKKEKKDRSADRLQQSVPQRGLPRNGSPAISVAH